MLIPLLGRAAVAAAAGAPNHTQGHTFFPVTAGSRTFSAPAAAELGRYAAIRDGDAEDVNAVTAVVSRPRNVSVAWGLCVHINTLSVYMSASGRRSNIRSSLKTNHTCVKG